MLMSTKLKKNNSQLKPFSTKKHHDIRYAVRIVGPGLGRTQNKAGWHGLMGSQPSLLMIGSPTNLLPR